MKRIKYLALAALVGVWACSSDNTSAPEITGTITGTVSIEGAGADGISVALSSGASTTTAGGGAYSFTGVPGGAYTVTISDYPTDVTFSSTSKAAAIQTAGQSVPVDFSGSYIRTASIIGSVTAGGTGIAGVSVAADGPGGTQNKVTDANGGFNFTALRAGSYTVTISNIPATYNFTTTTQTVTVAAGATEQAQFSGTKTQDEVTASVVIQSVKLPNGTSANPANIFGQIDVTLQIDPGTNQLSQVCVLLDDAVVPNGCQTLSSAVAGADDLPMAADGTLTATFSLLTNSFNATTGAADHGNGDHTLSAKLDLTNATQSSVQTTMGLTFNNQDIILATVEPAVTAVGGPDSDFGEGKLWYGGDQTVHLLVVLYSGKTLSTAAVTFYGCEGFDETITADEFPGDVVFSAADDTEPLWDYESCDADDDVFEVGGALYDDGTSAAVLNGTLASGPNGMTHNIDEVGPWDVPLELTDQVIEWESGTACCSNNWVGADYAFADGLVDDPGDDGAGIGTTEFYVGAAGDDEADVIAGTPVETAGDAGLDLSFTNDEYTVYVVYTDKVGNQTVVQLSGNGDSNDADTFGFDNTMPTAFKLSAASEPDKIIYNIANGGPGLDLSFSATEDRAGFSSVPISGYLVLYAAGEDPFYAIAQDDADGGAINLPSFIPACDGSTPDNGDPCYPNDIGQDAGIWMFDAVDQDQAGNRTTTHIQRMALVDAERPLTQNVALPPQVIANQAVTYSAPVTDNHELWSVAFGTDFETAAGSGTGDGVFLPFGENVDVGDGNRWDMNFPTSGSAVLTLNKAVVARELAPAGVPSGDVGLATNVQAITTDAAGNQSLPAGNNFLAGTVDPTDKAASFAPATQDWAINTDDDYDLCNGQGSTACDVAPDGTDVTSVDFEITAMGASGTYANPFGASGVIYIYVNIPTGGYYTDTNAWYLIGSINASSAALTDDGSDRTYTWTFTVTSDDVAAIGDGTAINVVAMGLNAATGTLLVSDPHGGGVVTVINGTN